MAWIRVGNLNGEPYIVNTKYLIRYYTPEEKQSPKGQKKVEIVLVLQEGEHVNELTCEGMTPTEVQAKIAEAEASDEQKLKELLEERGF